MRGDGVAGTLTVAPDVAGSRASLPRERAEKRAGGGSDASRERAAAQSPMGQGPIRQGSVGDGPQPRIADGPQSKEQIVASLFDAFSRHDFLSALPLLHPEVVFQPMTAEVTRAGEPYRGHEGIRRYAEDVESYWEELTVHPAQIRAAGRAVVVLGLASGSGPAGSFENAPTTWVIKFKDGLVFAVQIFSDARHVVGALVGEDDD
jgi:ketosteroid isomerase-like protein